MAAKRFTGVRLDEELIEGLERLRDEHGATVGESIRRAVREYLERKGAINKADRKRVAARKRS